MHLIARVISYIFHPLLLATYLVMVIGWFVPQFLSIPRESFWPFVGFVFVLTFILPVSNLLMFRMFGTVSSFQMPARRERLFPFAVITVLYVVVTVMFYYKAKGNFYFNKVMVLITIMVFAATVLTLFEKVSIHSLAICGAIGIFIPLMRAVNTSSLLWPTIVTVVLAGLIMSSRLYLNAHTPRQVMIGAISGYIIGFFGMYFLF